jgi:hypothetical protein
MSDHIDDGGPAFPNSNDVCGCYGMTLRDWFAGQAMAAMVTPHTCDDRIAQWSYQTADAMIAERAKEATK